MLAFVFVLLWLKAMFLAPLSALTIAEIRRVKRLEGQDAR